MIIPLNITFDLSEALEYFDELKKSYAHLKWTTEYSNDVEDADKHQLDGFYGWGIQSNLMDLSAPCPPYNVHKEKGDQYRDTELVFGFVKKLKTFFPEVRQLGIAVHPPGIEIAQHIDNDEYFKIHIPLITNPSAYFIFGESKHVMLPGTMYLVETKLPHGTCNYGTTDRVHLIFKCPRKYFDQVKNLTGTL